MRLKSPAPTARLGGSPAGALDKPHALVAAARPPGPDPLDQQPGSSHFQVGIPLRSLDGLLEVLGGLLLLVVCPATIDRVVTSLTQHELSEDPTTSWLPICCGPPRLTGAAVLFAAVYLLAHGMVKAVLVAALLTNQLWAYPLDAGLLVGFIGYQRYRLRLKPSVGLAALTSLDAVIAWLTYREYRKQLAVVRCFRSWASQDTPRRVGIGG